MKTGISKPKKSPSVKRVDGSDELTNLESNSLENELYNLFSALDTECKGIIPLARLIKVLNNMGIQENDPRIKINTANLSKSEDDNQAYYFDFSDFKNIIKESNGSLIKDAIQGNLIIPDFAGFVKEIKSIFDTTKLNEDGKVASYIPQLGRVNPDQYAVSICTIDGQKASFGDSEKFFCIQSISKPINYAIALETFGEDIVHQHVGREPSGISFNGLVLNDSGLPHNPMINAGAIMTCSMVRPDLEIADRFDYVLDKWTELSGGIEAKFNNSVYLSERQTADRNFALGYFMKENKAFPENTDLVETLEFYFQCCSIEVTTEALAVTAASFANAGVCPATGVQSLRPDTVKNVLSLMYSCGMYNFSGEFAFTIGLPAKSGVGGGLLIVVPNLMGIAIWSPRLDQFGNSVRGTSFCKELVHRFNFHNYDSLIKGVSNKKDPRLQKNESHINGVINLCWAASSGDMYEVQQLIARGVDVNTADYDGRTALHLAASEGHHRIVEYLILKGADVSLKDRWGNTPLEDAIRSQHTLVIDYIRKSTKSSPVK
jgi:glutaminase